MHDNGTKEISAITDIGARAFRKYNYEIRTKFPLILYTIEFRNILDENFIIYNCSDFYN